MSSVKKNFAYNALYQILVILVPLVTVPYLSRVLGPEALGTYSYTYSIASYFILFSTLGVKNYGVRCIAKVSDDRQKRSYTFCSIYGLQLIMSLLVLAVYFIYTFFFAQDYLLVRTVMSAVVVSALFDISWFFFGLEQFKITVTRNVVVRITTLLLIFLVVHTEADLWKYAAIMAGGLLVNQMLLWPFVIQCVDLRPVGVRDVLHHIKPNLMLFIPVIAVSLYHVMDKIMLGAMSDMTQVGFYENSEKAIDIPMGLIVAFGTVMMPRMSYLVEKKDDRAVRENLRSSMEFSVFLGAAMMFGIAGIAPVFAPFFFGEKFTVCGSLITWISPVILLKSWANVIRNQYLLPNHRDKEYMISVILGAVVNLISNVILIPKIGAMGAIIGTVIAEGMVCVSQTVMVRKELDVKLYFRKGYKYVMIGIVMFIMLRWIAQIDGTMGWILLLQLLLGGSFYLLLSFSVYSQKKEVIMQISHFLKQRNHDKKYKSL